MMVGRLAKLLTDFRGSEEDIPKQVSHFITGTTDDVTPYCISRIPEGTKQGKLNPHPILSVKNLRLARSAFNAKQSD